MLRVLAKLLAALGLGPAAPYRPGSPDAVSPAAPAGLVPAPPAPLPRTAAPRPPPATTPPTLIQQIDAPFVKMLPGGAQAEAVLAQLPLDSGVKDFLRNPLLWQGEVAVGAVKDVAGAVAGVFGGGKTQIESDWERDMTAQHFFDPADIALQGPDGQVHHFGNYKGPPPTEKVDVAPAAVTAATRATALSSGSHIVKDF